MQDLPEKIRPANESQIRAMLLGMYGYGPHTGVTRWTREHAGLTQLLCSWIRQHDNSFVFTSIQINWNYSAQAHVDANNVGPSHLIALGSFEGGELWIAHPDGSTFHTVTSDEASHLRGLYKVGQEAPGNIVDVKKSTPHVQRHASSQSVAFLRRQILNYSVHNEESSSATR